MKRCMKKKRTGQSSHHLQERLRSVKRLKNDFWTKGRGRSWQETVSPNSARHRDLILSSDCHNFGSIDLLPHLLSSYKRKKKKLHERTRLVLFFWLSSSFTKPRVDQAILPSGAGDVGQKETSTSFDQSSRGHVSLSPEIVTTSKSTKAQAIHHRYYPSRKRKF